MAMMSFGHPTPRVVVVVVAVARGRNRLFIAPAVARRSTRARAGFAVQRVADERRRDGARMNDRSIDRSRANVEGVNAKERATNATREDEDEPRFGVYPWVHSV